VDSVAGMTTRWKDKLSEVASSTPEYLHTAKAAWPFLHMDPMSAPSGLGIPRTADLAEAFLAGPEILPDYSHCGINE